MSQGECESCVLRRCRSQRRQNKSPASNASAKQEKLIDRYIGRPLAETEMIIVMDRE